jgi:hypothetical protein
MAVAGKSRLMGAKDTCIRKPAFNRLPESLNPPTQKAGRPRKIYQSRLPGMPDGFA